MPIFIVQVQNEMPTMILCCACYIYEFIILCEKVCQKKGGNWEMFEKFYENEWKLLPFEIDE